MGGSCTEEEQVISFTRFILTDFMANCRKHSLAHRLHNEQAPFVEYVVLVLKYFSAVFNNIFFPMVKTFMIGCYIGL
jgi:hypothetical protein